MGSVSCAQMVRGDIFSYGPTRAPGFYMIPRPDPYRPHFKKDDGTIDSDGYINFIEEFIQEGSVNGCVWITGVSYLI